MMNLAWAALAALLCEACLFGCAEQWEQATVTISYASEETPNERALRRFGRMRVEESFHQFAKRHGYECKPHIKRVQEIRCRGPQGLRMVFQPSPNKPEFTARFSWANVGGRTHEKFKNHVLDFEHEFSSLVGASYVHLAAGN